MTKRNYVIYCDESDRKGRYYSNFFGGAILKAEDRQPIDSLLKAKKAELNLGQELKWERVTANYLEKYIEFVNYYFDFVETGRLRLRMMFTQNIHEPVGLSKDQVEDTYFRLYYQFVKHGFGIKYSNPNLLDHVTFSLLFDQLPDTLEKGRAFKGYISAIPAARDMHRMGFSIPSDQMADVDSKNHEILQGLDVVLGAMSFRLNNKHLEKPAGARRRGKRTIAKEKLYKIINARIRRTYPNFNIGVSTGNANGPSDRWTLPYSHWLFVPTQHEYRPERGKRWTPPEPT